MSEVININDKNFETDVVKSDIPVLIDFWAPWCAPCKAISPMLDVLAEEYQDKAKIVKVNIDECPEIAAQFGVRGIPALFVFKNGEVVDQANGAMPKGQLSALLDKHL